MSRYFQFFLVIIASGAIFPLIYLKAQYQETILAVYNISLEQLNAIFTFLGIACIVGYFPSGLLCDKFSAKKLLAISLLGTAAGGIWFAQVPPYSSVVIIFVIWGFFSVFTFWAAHLKIVQMLAEKNEQGRFQGILEAGKGLVEAILASIAVTIFTSKTPANVTDPAGLREPLLAVVYMYIVVLILAAVLVLIFVKEVKPVTGAEESDTDKKEENGFSFALLGTIFKNKYVYLHGGILFAGYVIFWTNYYFGGFLQTNVGMTATTASQIMVAVLWMRPIGGFLGGFMADKFGKSKTNGLAMLLGCISVTAMVFMPTSSTAVYAALTVFAGLTLYIVRGTYWSLLGEANINPVILGTAIGVISIIGYLPDIILPNINTYLTNSMGTQAGTSAYLMVSVAIGLIGFVLGFFFRAAQRADAKKLAQQNNK